MRHFRNPGVRAAPRVVLDPTGAAAARREMSSWPGYAPTPLLGLPAIARRAGIGRLFYKDEAGRFGLGSFKALGGAYAVLRLVSREAERVTGRPAPSSRELMAGARKEIASRLTVVTATDGNHGRSVAWGATLFGCRCVVYVPEAVSLPRRHAIERLGAAVVEVAGDYDAAVRQCAADAAAERWRVVSDTTYPGYEDIPQDVMQGYRVMIAEALEQAPAGAAFTHVLVQGGVGALAAAVAQHLSQQSDLPRPRLVVVEPDAAECLYRSALAGRATRAEGDLHTVMGGLACGEPSLLAWEILAESADDFLTIPDEVALEAMRCLAAGADGDPEVVAGESGAAGVGALLAAAASPAIRRGLALSRESSVLVFGTEGATDPEIYRRIVGR